MPNDTATRHTEKPKKHDWYDILTLLALVAAFVAAGALAVLTKCSLNDARIATSEAHADNVAALARASDANRLASQTAERQLRPYVGIVAHSIKIKCVACAEQSKDSTSPIPQDYNNRLVFGLKNFGATPAQKPRLCVEWLPMPPNAPIPAQFIDDLVPNCLTKIKLDRMPTIWPGEERPYFSWIANPKAIYGATATPKFDDLYILGLIFYQEGPSLIRHSYFCFQYYYRTTVDAPGITGVDEGLMGCHGVIMPDDN